MKQVTRSILAAFCFGIFLSSSLSAQSLFKDLIPGPHPASGTPNYYMKANGKMFFVTEVITGGLSKHQLWKSDGTVTGTVLVKDSLTITNIYNPVLLRADVNGTLFFTVIDDPGCSTCAPELWKSDGTTAGTVMVTTLDYTQGVGSAPNNFVAMGNKLIFTFGQNNGSEIWVSDGTAAGTMEVIDLAPGTFFGQQIPGAPDLPIISYNGKVYFQGCTNIGNNELFSTDGTAAGTTLLSEINPSSFGGSDPSGWSIYNNELFFSADDGGANAGIWKTDGTLAGTVSVKPGVGFARPTVFQNELYFGSDNYSLWKTDGTTAGTVHIKDSVGNPRGANNDFVFTHFTKSLPSPPYYVNVLWKSDGTTAGTVTTPFDIGMTSSLDVIGNNMYTSRLDSGSVSNIGVWVTDGTNGGTSKLLAGFGTGPVFIYNNKVFFCNYETATGYELWSIDPGLTGIVALQKEDHELSIFPNPSTGMISIDVPNFEAQFTVEIYTIGGEKIASQQTQKQLDLSNAPKGIYFAKIYAGERIFTSKIVIQ